MRGDVKGNEPHLRRVVLYVLNANFHSPKNLGFFAGSLRKSGDDHKKA